MNVSEAAGLLVDQTRAVSTARAERDAWRTLALVLLEQLATVHREAEMLTRDSATYRSVQADAERRAVELYDIPRQRSEAA